MFPNKLWWFFGGLAHNKLIIDKINLREIRIKEKETKLIEGADADRYYLKEMLY